MATVIAGSGPRQDQRLYQDMAVELGPAIRANAVVPGAILPAPGADPDGEEGRSRGRAVPVGRV